METFKKVIHAFTSDKFVPTIVLLQNTFEKEHDVAQIFVTDAEDTQQFVIEQFVITLERILALTKDALLLDRVFEQCYRSR